MKRFSGILLSFIMIFSMFSTVFAGGIDGAMQKAKINVAVNAVFPPFEYYENGELCGFDIELMNLIGDKIGFDIEYTDMNFDELIPAVINGETDCAISTIAVTDERKKVIDFSVPYLNGNMSYYDGDVLESMDEQYAIVFPVDAEEKGKVIKAAEFDDISVYNSVNEAIDELIKDKTIEKLGEKYNINKRADTDTFNFEYTFISGSEDKSDGKPLAPPSDWALSDVEKAEALEITQRGKVYRYSMSITREEFCEMVYSYYEKYADEIQVVNAGNPFLDTENKDVLVLHALGIIKGKSEKEFAPKDLLTREEAATILLRLINVAHPDWAATELFYDFADLEEISGWAMNSVQNICNMRIMKGVGDNRFAPQESYTTEQAIATLTRVYASFSEGRKEDKWEDMSFADKVNANMPVDKNYVFSPLSVKTALMMAANGAEGETLNEILKALDVENLECYNESVRQMLDKYAENDVLKLDVSNSVWINSDKTDQRFSEEYKEKLSKFYDGTVDIVTDDNAESRINSWVNEKTKGKIPTIITEENKDFGAMLVNAVYFKGRWQKEFYKGATEKDIFKSRDSSEKEIDFMNRTGWIGYSDADGVSVVELPFLTRYDVIAEDGEYLETKYLENMNISMYLMMSEGSFSPEETLNNAEFKNQYMNLSVPKFNIDYSTGMNDILKTIGINRAFEENAEFNNMFDNGNMWIDSTIHKTYIKVDEEGTEAAAVMAIGMAGSALPPEPVDVKFNKPFTFVIRDNINGEILFMGEYAFAE